MKITKAENYKKPHYAVAVAAAAMIAVSVAGCGSPEIAGTAQMPEEERIMYEGETQVGAEEEVTLAGDVQVVGDPIDYDGVLTIDTGEELTLDGDVAVWTEDSENKVQGTCASDDLGIIRP